MASTRLLTWQTAASSPIVEVPTLPTVSHSPTSPFPHRSTKRISSRQLHQWNLSNSRLSLQPHKAARAPSNPHSAFHLFNHLRSRRHCLSSCSSTLYKLRWHHLPGLRRYRHHNHPPSRQASRYLKQVTITMVLPILLHNKQLSDSHPQCLLSNRKDSSLRLCSSLPRALDHQTCTPHSRARYQTLCNHLRA